MAAEAAATAARAATAAQALGAATAAGAVAAAVGAVAAAVGAPTAAVGAAILVGAMEVGGHLVWAIGPGGTTGGGDVTPRGGTGWPRPWTDGASRPVGRLAPPLDKTGLAGFRHKKIHADLTIVRRRGFFICAGLGIAGQPQQPFGDDVELYFGRTAVNSGRAAGQHVFRPLAGQLLGVADCAVGPEG